jgi:hypothetical protein
MAPRNPEQNPAPTEGTGTEPSAGSATESKIKFAKFTGASVVVRRITAKDIKNVDEAYDGGDIEFSPENKHEVDVSNLSSKVVELLAAQPNIKISEKSA